MVLAIIIGLIAVLLTGFFMYWVGYLKGVLKTNNHFYKRYNELNVRYFKLYNEAAALEKESKWLRECNQQLIKAENNGNGALMVGPKGLIIQPAGRQAGSENS